MDWRCFRVLVHVVLTHIPLVFMLYCSSPFLTFSVLRYDWILSNYMLTASQPPWPLSASQPLSLSASPLKWSPPLPDARNIMSSYLVIKQCNSTSNLPQARQGKARHPALIFSFYMNWALLLCFLFMLCWRIVLLCLCCIVLLRFWPFLFCVTTEIY